MDKTQTLNVEFDRVSLLLLFSACQVSVSMIMRSCNLWAPEECLVCIKRRNVTG